MAKILEVYSNVKRVVPSLPSVSSKNYYMPVVPGLPLMAVGIIAFILSRGGANPVSGKTLAAMFAGTIGYGVVTNLAARSFDKWADLFLNNGRDCADERVDLANLVYALEGIKGGAELARYLLEKQNKFNEEGEEEKKEILNSQIKTCDYLLERLPSKNSKVIAYYCIVYPIISCIAILTFFNKSLYNQNTVKGAFTPYVRYALDFIVPNKYKSLIDLFANVICKDFLRFLTDMTINQLNAANISAFLFDDNSELSDKICEEISYKKVLLETTAELFFILATCPIKYCIKSYLGGNNEANWIRAMIIDCGSRYLVEKYSKKIGSKLFNLESQPEQQIVNSQPNNNLKAIKYTEEWHQQNHAI